MEINYITNTDRQIQIMQLLRQQGRITVAELCSAYGISEATARRDLEALASDGKIQRVHGGAILTQHAPPEMPILHREFDEADAKRLIGSTAAQLVKDGETVFISSGTTALEAARALRQRQGLTVITNSLPVLTMFSSTNNTLVALGGMFRPSELSFIGHITEQALAEVRADTVILGIRAISLDHGLTNDYLPEAMTDRAILRAGKRVILVADHTKFARVSTAYVAPVSAVHTIVTDPHTTPDLIQDLRELEIEVILANGSGAQR